MTKTEVREIASSYLALRLSEAPYDIYVEAMRRQTSLIERAAKAPKARQAKLFAEYDQCTNAVRAYYALRRAA